MVQTGMQGTTVRELRNAFEANTHARESSLTAQSNAELSTQLAVQERMHQTFTLEAKCRATLATRDSQATAVLAGIGQRHDALVLLENSLDQTRTRIASLRAASESDSASYTANQSYELEKFQTRLTEEVTNAEAEVAARGEVLRRFIAEAVAKAALEQDEFRDAVSRARTAAEARYHADLLRERGTHERARNAMATNVDSNVTHTCDLALQVRENELMRDRLLKGHEIGILCASGQQLVAQLQCALREIDLRRAGGTPTQPIADSHLPVDPPIIFEMVESGSGLEVLSCTEVTSMNADAPADEANPHLTLLTYPTQTMTATTTITQTASSSSKDKAPPETERFAGRGERLGRGGKGGDGDDDGNDPEDWKVVDDGRDGNAKKKEDEEEEEMTKTPPGIANAPAGEPTPAGADADAIGGLNAQLPIASTNGDDDHADTSPATLAGTVEGETMTGAEAPGHTAAPCAPYVNNLLGPGDLEMPSGIATSLAFASPPQRKVTWKAQPAQFSLSPEGRDVPDSLLALSPPNAAPKSIVRQPKRGDSGAASSKCPGLSSVLGPSLTHI